MGVADAEADQEARVEAIVDTRRGAAEIVGERAGIGVAQDAAQAAQRTEPRAERTDTIARRDLASLRQRLALSRARRAARIGHLLAQRIHEHHAAVGVHGAEVGIGLAADRVQRQRALHGVEAGDHPQHRGEVAAGRGEGLVEGDADRPLVGRQRQETGREGGLAERQGEEHVVGVVGERRCQEGEVAGDARVDTRDSAGGAQDRVGRAVGVVAGLGQYLHRAALDRRRAADIDAVGLARRIGLDLVGAAGRLGVVAVDRQRADRVAGGQRAGHHDVAADNAVAAERAGRTHRDIAGDAAVHRQRAGQHRGAAAVDVVAGEVERAQALLGQSAAAGEARREGDVVAVGVEGAAARAERRQLRGDVGGAAARPLQPAAVQQDVAGAEVAGRGEVYQAASHRRAARGSCWWRPASGCRCPPW